MYHRYWTLYKSSPSISAGTIADVTTYPTRPELVRAIRDSVESLDGNDATIVTQAIALLHRDGLTLGPGDKAKLRRFASEINGKP